MKIRKIDIPAIHDKDLENILSSYNLLQDFKEEELNCFNCNEIINNANLTGVVVQNDTLIFVCSNPDCLAHATSKSDENE